MAPPLLSLTDIALTFGGKNLLDGASLSISAGDRLCLVGRNGSGKSTLLKIAASQVAFDRGTRFLQPGASMRTLAQEPDFSGHSTVLSFVEAGLNSPDDAYLVPPLLADLGLSGAENPATLSGGEARRAALAQCLAPMPDILLLDEPTNHLDLATIEWLEAELKSRRSALILISHDRRFLSNLTRATLWLDRGRTRLLNEGFGAFEAWRDAILTEEELNQHKLGRKIEAEEHWLRYGVTARRKRNVRRLEGLRSLRTEKREHRGAQGKAVIAAAEAEQSGTLVIEAKRIAKAYGARKIVDDFSLRVLRKDRIGIVGPNGAGKTTLITLLTGVLAPDSGSLRLGVNLDIATLEQNRDSLSPDTALADALTGGGSDQVMVGDKPRHVIGYMKDFLFAPEQARTPLRVLSGGERAKVMLARALAKPSNLLVLDEPTNDLDLETLDVLEDMLSEYPGTVLIVSHDRDFIDRVVNKVIVPEGKGQWRVYAGGYSDMLTQRGAGFGGVGPAEKAAPAKATTSPAAPKTVPSARKRLSFHERHQLETLPATMAKLKSAITQLQDKLSDPGFYARDAKAFSQASELLATAQSELSAQEETWLTLEILREECEG